MNYRKWNGLTDGRNRLGAGLLSISQRIHLKTEQRERAAFSSTKTEAFS